MPTYRSTKDFSTLSTTQQASTRIIITQDLLVVYMINTTNYEWIVNEIIKIEQELRYDVLAVLSTNNAKVIRYFEENKIRYLLVDKEDDWSTRLKKAFYYALKHSYKFVVEFDDDKQYNYKEIEKLHRRVLRGFDIVIGSRVGNASYRESAANQIIKNALNVLNLSKLDDVTCYFRLFNWNAMKLYLNDPKLKVEPYSYAFLKRHEKFKIINQPVSIRKNNQSYQNDITEQTKFGLSQASKIVFRK